MLKNITQYYNLGAIPGSPKECPFLIQKKWFNRKTNNWMLTFKGAVLLKTKYRDKY